MQFILGYGIEIGPVVAHAISLIHFVLFEVKASGDTQSLKRFCGNKVDDFYILGFRKYTCHAIFTNVNRKIV